ncbi:hypothetical protein QWZ08_17055 [Ferruginibacter paludis]|uniref:hypothetical protein n=1 Tax=Ferruginibacter paludis TaxID=1310417 RepID=UPI0025B44BA2|nr:hypothetical protein [Ferruginibacter paludis]MDN3657363.1 hypothetical protein [Ferruginibacter paludis]
MEETNFVLLWKEQYEKIDQSLVINKQLLKEVISQKAESALQSLIRFKTRGIVAAVVYLILLGMFLFYAISHYSSSGNYFILSIGAIFLINVKALYDYIKHLVWTNNIDYNGSITEIQQKLTKLQLSVLRHSRFMVLQFPFWTTFYLSDKWFPHSVSWDYIIFQFLLTSSFTFLAYWLYKNQTMESANKKWVKTLIEGSGGKSIIKAIAFYKELETFKQVS